MEILARHQKPLDSPIKTNSRALSLEVLLGRPRGGLGICILPSFLADLIRIQRHIVDCPKDQKQL